MAWPHITLDRSLPIPVYLQLKGHFTYLISTGALASGAKLPSVRELAEQLHLAPATVAQAFRVLGEQGLVEFRPGLGTFVVDMEVTGTAEIHAARVTRLVDRLLKELDDDGLSVPQLVQLLAARAPRRSIPAAGQRVAFVGHYAAELAVSARLLEHALLPLHASVVPLSIEDLRSDPRVRLDGTRADSPVVSVPMHFAEVKRLLSSSRRKVVGMTFVLCQSVREQLARLPESARVAIIATVPEFFGSMSSVVATHRPLRRPPACAVIGDPHAVRRVLAGADTVVYAMGTRDRVRQLVPPDMQSIELLHEPDARSIARLKSALRRSATSAKPTTTTTIHLMEKRARG